MFSQSGLVAVEDSVDKLRQPLNVSVPLLREANVCFVTGNDVKFGTPLTPVEMSFYLLRNKDQIQSDSFPPLMLVGLCRVCKQHHLSKSINDYCFIVENSFAV